MSTQLRLISRTDASPDASAAVSPSETASAATSQASDATPLPPRRRTATSAQRSARRAPHRQDQWRLDERTREVGRAGVAAARAALARAHPESDLRQAS